MIQKSAKAQKAWGLVPVQVRVAIGRKFMVSSEHNVPSNILHGSKKYMLL